MTRGSRLMMLGLGTLVSLAASPVGAQMVVGDSRPSVDINWGVLDTLGPEPTLPSLITRDPSASPAPLAPARRVNATPLPAPRPAAAPPPRPGIVYKPFGTDAEKPAAPAKPAKVVTEKPAPVPRAPAMTETVPEARVKPVVATPAPAPAEKPVASSPPPKPPKPDVAVDVPPPARPAPETKPKAPFAPAAIPATSLAAPVPDPAPVQFVKTPEPPPPAPVVAAPPPAPVVAAPPPSPVVQVVPPQVATVAPPAAAAVRKGDNPTVLFAADSDHLPESARADLERLAARMEKDESLNLQLLAYAAGEDANASKARRLSLTRALKVRTYLMELGVRSTRIEVRALGNKIEGGAPDRVDAVVTSR